MSKKQLQQHARGKNTVKSGRKDNILNGLLNLKNQEKTMDALKTILDRWSKYKDTEIQLKREICLFIYFSMKKQVNFKTSTKDAIKVSI